MFRINQVIGVGLLFIALASGVGCATISGGHARGRDVHASARIAGDATRVLVTWNPPRAADHFIQGVKLYTNDPLAPSLALDVMGSVRQTLVAEP